MRKNHSRRKPQHDRERGHFRPGPDARAYEKRGFDIQEIAEKLHEKGIEVKPPTLAKYLNEFRRGKSKKTDTPPPPGKTAPTPRQDRPATVRPGEFAITQDTPLEDL